jgi:uncharacterized FAD-dependent dehydrogenase
MEDKMAVIVNNIRMPLDAEGTQACEAALKLLKLSEGSACKTYIVKTSPDLRHRNSPSMVYSVGIELQNTKAEEAAVLSAASQSVTLRKSEVFAPQPGGGLLRGRPVIAGFGPAGMFAGLYLSKAGYRPLIIERGADVESRVSNVEEFWATGKLNTQSNVQFGEGGAGTFSDGKLVTRINDRLCETVLDEFVRHGAPESVKRLAKPHIGTDKLRLIVKSIRETILQNGGEIRFTTRLTGLEIKAGELRSVTLSGGEKVQTGALILAIGHSARDTFEMLINAGVRLEPKPFSTGVRIEHLQEDIDRGLYGALAGHPRLPHGEYQLSLRQGGAAVYTFCMCPGGTVVAAASEKGGVVTNGMSNAARDGRNANSAVAVSIEAFASPLEGIAFQRKLEAAAYAAGGSNYKAPFQTVGAFCDGSNDSKIGRVLPTYSAGVTPARLDTLLPQNITDMLSTGLSAFDRKLTGFGARDALLTGVETRTSSPVRITRGESFEAVGIAGLYPAGEGAGYAGGIMSAAVDGLRVAGAIIEKFTPLA